MTDFNITYESTPAYDTWGWADYWSCRDWMFWFGELKSYHGKKEAKRLWITAWEKQGMWESNFNWCKYNSDFVSFSKDNDLDTGHVISNAVNSSGKLLDSGLWIVRNLNWILPISLIVVGGVYGYKYIKILK